MDIFIIFIFISCLINIVSSFSFYQRGESTDRTLGNSLGSLPELLVAQENLQNSLEETLRAEEHFIRNILRNQRTRSNDRSSYFQDDRTNQNRRRRNRRRKFRRSFDSISHRGGGLENMNVENDYHRQLEELIRQQQQRIHDLESGQISVPDNFEVVFPILNRDIQRT